MSPLTLAMIVPAQTAETRVAGDHLTNGQLAERDVPLKMPKRLYDPSEPRRESSH